MIFNKQDNYTIALEEFRLQVAVLDKKTDFELLIPDIQNAEYELKKIIGAAVFFRAQSDYTENDIENELVLLVQGAVANIAFRDYTMGNDLRHSVTGRKASINPNNEKQAWEFSIDSDNQQMNYRIQKALNRLIDYLDYTKISEWTGSVAFKNKHKVLLSDIDIFTRYYPIDNSLALFNQLLPIQMEMQRKHIAPLLGAEKLAQLLAIEHQGSGSGAGDDVLLNLFDYAGPALALWTMATGLKRLSVKLLPEGLVQQFKSSVQSRNSSFNVDPREKDLIISSLIKDAELATMQLDNQLKIIAAAEAQTVVVPVSTMADRNLAANKYFSV
jgi:hypothetical protein